MPTIAYLTSEYPALSHTFIRREIAALRAHGLDIRPFSVRPGRIDWGEAVPSILGQGKARVVGCALRALVGNPAAAIRSLALAQRHREKGLRGWLWSLFHWLEALCLTTMLRGTGAERVHSHFANSGATVGLIAAHHLRIPWSLTLHGISETDPPAGALLADKIRCADFVACASWFMRAQGMRLVEPEHWGKMHIVRCGVSLPGESDDAPRPTVRHFITVGRVSAEKGYPGLVEAFGQVKAHVPDATMTVIGDGHLRAEFEAQLERSGLTGSVTVLGGQPEERTLAEIARADAFVLPSLMEGLPVVLMEAMACGKPVVAATVAGIPELVRDGETGLLFRPGDWSHLASQMLRLTADEALAVRVGEAGRARVGEEFTIERAVLPLLSLFSAPGGTAEQPKPQQPDS